MLIKEVNHFDKIINFFVNSCWSKIGIYVKLMRSLKEMEELKKFQSSTFDTIARRRPVEDQDTILELTGKIQELQNEIDCMNDSRDFQDAESVRSGHSHVTSQPVFFPPHPIPGGMQSRSLGMPSRREWAAKHLVHTWYIRKRFCKSRYVIFSTLSAGVESIGVLIYQNTHHTCGEWEPNTSSGSEMNFRTVSQKFSDPQWGRLFKELWGRPTTTADFRSSFRQIPFTSNVCLLEDKIQDRGMYLFTISYGSDAVDQRSGVGWFSGWFEIFVIYSWYFNAEFWRTWCEDCFSTEQNHP